MKRGITVSLTAVDLLCDQFELGTPPVIFDIPRVGMSMADRARIRDAVLADLAERDLSHGDQVDTRVTKRLALICRAPLAIEATGVLNGNHHLCAVAASNGKAAVLAVLEDQSLRLSALRPTALVPAVLELIGRARPGPGRSFTYPATAVTEQPPAGLLRTGYATSTSTESRRILTQPRLQVGVFTVVHRDKHDTTRPALLWFDTDAGRYLGYVTPGADGRTWATYAPADNPRLARHLTNLIIHR
jgi:EspG family